MGMRDDAYVLPAVSGARIVRLLADGTRLRILALLGKMPNLCVCEFVAEAMHFAYLPPGPVRGWALLGGAPYTGSHAFF